MKISAKAEYACLAILALAQPKPDGAPVRIREIADANAIPERYLVQILLQLKGAGLVHSTRGASGGYRLARPPESISLREVLSAIDGPNEVPRESSGPAGRVLTIVAQKCCTPARCQSRSAASQSGQAGTRAAGSQPASTSRNRAESRRRCSR